MLHEDSHYYLQQLFADVKIMTQPKVISQTYGEILSPSVTKIITKIAWHDQDIFMDLGSGLGKVVLQVFLQTHAKTCIGIEIDDDLHQVAALKAQILQNDCQDRSLERELLFINQDFLGVDFNQGTVLLIGSPCYGPSLLASISAKIEEASNIRAVFSLKPLMQLRRLKFKSAFQIECSWDSAMCYFYNDIPRGMTVWRAG